MAFSCEPQPLVTAAKCFSCLNPEQREWVKLWLLQQAAGNTDTPEELVEKAKCFSCLGPKQLKEVQAYLLCKIAGGT